jgi:DNA topoisomerase-1
MGKILVIVESPGKIQKMQSYLGDDYLVVASVGHIIDLDPKSMSVDIDNDFKPTYKPIDRQVKTIQNLKSKAAKASEVVLATDKDREGEMIAWSIAHVLKLKDPKRLLFDAITKDQIDAAIKKPSKINQDLVNAQKARRILDRIVGFELSPMLWRHVKKGLSAGRVQSVVVELIIDREDKVNSFIAKGAESFFKYKGNFISSKSVIHTNLHTLNSVAKDGVFRGEIAKIDSEEKSREFLKNSMQSTFKVANVYDKKKTRSPNAPFTTSTLQQEAFKKMGFSGKRTMSSAQRLYEAGHITYMRTDSVSLSKEALTSIKLYVEKTYGDSYYLRVNYKGKSKNTQEAHEAVRPTKISREYVSVAGKLGSDEVKLYSLIWKRSVASQMKPAEYNVTTLQIAVSKVEDYFFETSIEKLTFPGFLKVYNIQNMEPDSDSEEDDDSVDIDKDSKIKLPSIGSTLDADSIVGTQEYSKPPSRYNEGALVKELDEDHLNIGRPATTVSIIEKIQYKGYVVKKDIPGEEKDSLILSWNGKKDKKIDEEGVTVLVGKEDNKYVPTALGVMVNDLLISGFPKIMDYKFTAGMEDRLDEIAAGEKKWVEVLDVFYKEFHPLIEEFKKKKPHIEDKFTRKIGIDPETGYEIVATMGIYGPMVKLCGDKPSQCKSAPIKEPLTIKSITLKDALKLFEYPKELGVYNRKKVLLQTGKFGLYIKYDNKNFSINPKKKEPQFKKPDEDTKDVKEDERYKIIIKDPANITLEEAIKVVDSQTKPTLAQIKDGSKIYTVLEGPYGKYINVEDSKKKTGKPVNVGLPKDVKVEDLNPEKIQELITSHFEKRKNRFKKKGSK